MRKPNSHIMKLFCVVQFVDLPFDGIDKHICVPRSWLIPRMISGEKVPVAYPNDEDSHTTKDRVKNKEKPNEEWRFYLAVIEYESDTFENADNWIKNQNDHKSYKMKNSGTNVRDSQPEPMLRRLRSASHPFSFDTKFDKPPVSVKPYKNPRKPLPRISIRLPFQLMFKKRMTQRVKLQEIANPVNAVINHPGTVSEHLKEKHSIIVTDNQLIQSVRTGIAATSDDKTSDHTLPDVITGDKSVMSEQSASPKLPLKNQPLPASQIGEQTLSLTDIDTGFDDNDHEDDVADHEQFELLKEDTILPGKTPSNSPDQVPQSEPVIERSTPLVHHKHSLSELRLQDIPARQSKEADINPSTQLFQVLTTPITVPRPCSTLNQFSQDKYPQWAFLPSTSATHQNPRPQGTSGSSSIEVTHNHQIPHSQDFVNNTSSPPYYATNLMNPSGKLIYPSIKKKSSSVTKNPVAKKICLDNIMRNTSTRQHLASSTTQLHLPDNSVVKPVPRLAQKYPEEAFRQPISSARNDFSTNAIDLSIRSQQGMTTSAARNLSYLAQHSRPFEQADIQHYSLVQKQHLEQIARLNSKFEHPNIRYSTDRHAHTPDATNSEFTLRTKPNSHGQTNQLLSQYNNQYGYLNEDSMQEVMRREFHTGLIGRAHTNSTAVAQNFDSIIQYPTQYSLNQSHHNFENLQHRQDPPRYQVHSGPSLKFNTNPQGTECQGVIKSIRSPALPKPPSQPLLNVQQGYLSRDPRVRVKLNQNTTEHQILNLVVSRNLVYEIEPTMVNAEVQTAPLPDRLDEMPSALLPGIGIAYQNPRTKKLVVDQATKTDPIMDVGHCENQAAESSGKSTPQVADSGCQTEGYFAEEQDSPYEETDSESEISTDDVVLDRGACEAHLGADIVSESRLTSPQNLLMQQRLAAEQEMLNTCGNFFTQIGESFHCTRDLFNHLRNSIIKGVEVYDSLLEKINKFNETEQLQIPTSLPNDNTSKASKENISENSSAENITSISSASKINNLQRNKLVLPPEFDPNNPKWTRKYQEKGPGLVELIPRTNIYVSKVELKNCKRESKNCPTLARMLLTEVFSRNALSVCWMTSGKAKAFSSYDLDIRPPLDDEARMVLLTFVERYGAKRGWKTDNTPAIISSMRRKILEVRAKYGQASRS